MAGQLPFDRPPLPLEPEQEFHLSQWIAVVRRRYRLLVAVCGVVLGVSVVKYAMTPKEYRATTTLQIERRVTGIASMENLFRVDPWDMEFYPTQYRLLQSRGLAERVVKNLRLAEDPVFNPARASLPAGKAPAVSAADDQAMLGALAGKLLGGLEVNPIRNTRLVEVSYRAPTPELAARVANGVAEAFIDWGIETRYATVGKASSFLASQIETLKGEIQDKEAQLQAYSRRTDIVALDPGSNVTMQRLEALNRDYVQAVSERISKESRYKELTSGPKETVADSLSGGLVSQLRQELLKMERDYATRLQTYKPEWPAMQELKGQIERARQHLASVVDETVSASLESARAEYQTALRREQALAAELARFKAEAMQLNSAAVEYNNLKVEVSTRRALLDDLLRKQSETEVASRLQGTRDSNVMVVDRALVPGGPYRPSLRRSLTLGLLLGLGLGLGAVFLAEYLDRTIKSPDDLDRILALPVLAVIPDVAGAKKGYGYGYGYGESRRRRRPTVRDGGESEPVSIELIPHAQPRLSVSEAYRSLRTALLLSTPSGLRTVVVTSAVAGEGKTATACNLAVVLAQLGRDVLLVDGDLRKPRLHEIFRVSNRLGLVHVLIGTAEPADVFMATSVPNLFVTPAGPHPPNPSELLASDAMRTFLEAARARFAYIVLDSPPVLPVTDSTVLGAQADGVVLCVGAGLAVRDDAVAGRDKLRLSEIKILGACLNRFRVSSGRYGGSSRYYAGYAYSGEDDARAER